MIGYCLRTSAAASFPSSTSLVGLYLFLGGLISVCATPGGEATRRATTIANPRTAEARVLIVLPIADLVPHLAFSPQIRRQTRLSRRGLEAAENLLMRPEKSALKEHHLQLCLLRRLAGTRRRTVEPAFYLLQ